jgi:hypothetical protein
MILREASAKNFDLDIVSKSARIPNRRLQLLL